MSVALSREVIGVRMLLSDASGVDRLRNSPVLPVLASGSDLGDDAMNVTT